MKLKGILIGLLLIPVIFYTYNGSVGRSPDWLNIAIFFIAAAVAYIYEARELSKPAATRKSSKIALLLLLAVAISFVLFTFRTPDIGIFRDPLTGGLGM